MGSSRFITHNHKAVPIHSFQVGGRDGKITLPKEQFTKKSKHSLDELAKQMVERHEFARKHGEDHPHVPKWSHEKSLGQLATNVGFRKTQDKYDHLTRPEKNYVQDKYQKRLSGRNAMWD